MIKRLISLIIICIFTLIVFIPAPSVKVMAEEIPYPDYNIAGSNSRFVLYYKTEKASIAVLDKANGKMWFSQLPGEQFPPNVTEEIKNEFNSLIVLSYTLMNKSSSTPSVSPLESLKNYKATANVLTNGLEYVISIEDINLKFSILVELNENGIDFSIPDDKISEGGDKAQQLLETKKTKIIKFLDDTLAAAEEMKNKNNVPSNIYSDLNTGLDGIRKIRNQLDEITDAIGIEDKSNTLLEKLNEVQNYITGSASKPGFFIKIIKSDKIAADIKAEYSKKQSEFESAIMPVKITISSLKEINVGSIVEIKVMPYFGACNDDVTGYMLYPNGSGAITEFKKKHGNYSSDFKLAVFSDQTPDIDWERAMDGGGLQRTMLPYYGVKQDNAAFIANIVSGQSESNIIFSPSGYTFNINRISSSFIFRRTIARTLSAGSFLTGGAVRFETDISKLNAKISFMFLANEEANYSGMARKLSDNLQKQKILVKNPILSQGVPLALDLLGGYNQKILIFNNYVPATTFKQAEQMVREITGDKKIPLLINYSGYMQSGFDIYPSTDEVSSQLGGKGGLKEFAKLVKDKGGFLFLQDNHIEAQLTTGRYNEGDLALGTNLRIFQSAAKDNFLLSPKVIFEKIKNSAVPFVKDVGAYGMTEDRLGSFVYYDYSTKYKSSRSQTIETWQNILSYEKEQLGGVAVTGGNEYVFPSVDWILNAPFGTSGYIYTDYAVPFYQMVIHGYIPYTSGAYNQFYDKQLQLLQSIEYGNLPYYKLTYNDIDTTEVSTFTSQYEVYYNEIIDIYNLYSKDLSGIIDKQMTNHTRNGDLVTVEYSDNSKIYINYGSEEIIEGEYIVKPMSYTITKPVGGEILEKEIKVVPQGKSNGVHLYSTLGYWVLFILLVPVVLFIGVILYSHSRQRNI